MVSRSWNILEQVRSSLRDAELDVESLESRWGPRRARLAPHGARHTVMLCSSVSRRPYASGSMAEAPMSSILVVDMHRDG